MILLCWKFKGKEKIWNFKILGGIKIYEVDNVIKYEFKFLNFF